MTSKTPVSDGNWWHKPLRWEQKNRRNIKQMKIESLPNQEEHRAKAMQLCFAVVAGLFAPPIGWVLGIFPLHWRHEGGKLNTTLVYFTAFVGTVFMAIAYSSRRKFEQSDDFSHYFDNFQNALSIHAPYFSYGSGIEVGIPIINYFLGLIFGNLSPWQLMLAYQLIFFGLLIWVVRRIRVQAIPNSLLISFVLVAFPYMLSTQLIRQCYSSLFLFLAIFEMGMSRRVVMLVLAFIFQMSALPLYLFFSIAKKLNGWRFLVFLMSIVFAVTQFQYIAEIVINAERFYGQEKMEYYINPGEGYVKSDLVPLLMYATIFFLGALIKIYRREWSFNGDEKIIVTAFIFSLAALPIPLLGLRVCLMVYLFIGVYFVKTARQGSLLLVRILFFLLLLYQLKTLLFSVAESDFGLWFEYPSYSIFPGYFFLR